jgi:hypothetical protein
LDIETAKRILEEPEPFVAEQWLRFLSDEQMELEDNILNQVREDSDFQFHFVMGGAGTGKTQVLLLLAEDLKDAGLKVGYFTTQGVREMVEKAGLDMPKENYFPGAVHLVDDPEEVGQVIEAYRRAKEHKARALVVAIDPFQWTERTAFLKLATILGDHNPSEDILGRRNTLLKIQELLNGVKPQKHYLRTAYRQAKETGAGSVALSHSIFQRMNPYVADEKMTQFASITKPYVQNILNGLSHVSDGGSFQVFENGNAMELWKIVAKLAARDDRWDWTDSILFVSDGTLSDTSWEEFQIEIPGISDQSDFEKTSNVQSVLASINARLVSFANPSAVRGQEFQDVVICVSKNRWKQFKTAKVGMGGPEWESIMPIHTFTTRAIDSVQILVG